MTSKAVALLTLFVCGGAFADPLPNDRPLAVKVKSGLVSTDDGNTQVEIEGGLYLNDLGLLKINAHIQAQEMEIAAARAERDHYKREMVVMSAKPELSWKAVLFLVGGGLVVGAAVAFAVRH